MCQFIIAQGTNPLKPFRTYISLWFKVLNSGCRFLIQTKTILCCQKTKLLCWQFDSLIGRFSFDQGKSLWHKARNDRNYFVHITRNYFIRVWMNYLKHLQSCWLKFLSFVNCGKLRYRYQDTAWTARYGV